MASSHELRPDGRGQWQIVRTDWPAAVAAHSSTLDPPQPSRARLLAPSTWRRGEQLSSPMTKWQTLKLRELTVGGDRSDVRLPGEINAFGGSLHEYVPLLFAAIQENRIATLCRLLEAGVDPNGYFHGQPPMGGAAVLGHMEIVRVLHQHGADATLPWVAQNGAAVLAPLHAAAYEGHCNVVRFLLDHCRVDIDMPREAYLAHDNPTKHIIGNAGTTAVGLACYVGHLATVAFLQSRGASLITPDDKGLTPLHAACWMGRDEVARFLLEKGVAVQPHTTDASRDTPLTLACKGSGTVGNDCEVVRILHEARADLEGPNASNATSTPFALAYRSGRRSVVDYLRGCGVGTDLGTGGIRGRDISGTHTNTLHKASPPASPESKQKRPKRTTPLRERAERVGVSDKLKATPPGVRETIDRGSPSSEEVRAAKKQLQAIQKANHQVVSRAELRLPRNALQKAAVDSQEAERKRNKRARPLSPQPGS